MMSPARILSAALGVALAGIAVWLVAGRGGSPEAGSLVSVTPVPAGTELSADSTAEALVAARGETIAAVNAARRRAGLGELAPQAALERAATGHAQAMLDGDFFGHESPDGTTPRERTNAAGYSARVLGETIAYGQRSADEVVAAWLDSPPHRRILLDREVTECGVGVAVGREGRGVKIVWVALAGAPRRASTGGAR